MASSLNRRCLRQRGWTTTLFNIHENRSNKVTAIMIFRVIRTYFRQVFHSEFEIFLVVKINQTILFKDFCWIEQEILSTRQETVVRYVSCRVGSITDRDYVEKSRFSFVCITFVMLDSRNHLPNGLLLIHFNLRVVACATLTALSIPSVKVTMFQFRTVHYGNWFYSWITGLHCVCIYPGSNVFRIFDFHS